MLMSATGRGSISSLLKVAVDVLWVVACAALGFIWIIAAFAIYSLLTGNSTFLNFKDYQLTTGRALTIWIAAGSIVSISIMIVCAYLRGVFETLVARDPFVPENAKRFTAIGIVLVVMEVLRMFLGMIVNIAFGVFSSTGEPIPWFPTFNWPVWIAIITLLILAQVFREGAAMREEQKMTI